MARLSTYSVLCGALLLSSASLAHAEDTALPMSTSGYNYIRLGADQIGKDEQVFVQAMADKLKEYPDFESVMIQGHTDAVGGTAFNQRLSLSRANQVKQALVELGIPATKINTVGMGATQPIASNKDDRGRALNRRIEFKVQWEANREQASTSP